MSKNTNKKKGEPQREHQFLEPHVAKRSISGKERGGPFARTPSLQELSPYAITSLQIEITCACCNVIDTFCL
jgi:hypothetical protein